MALSGSVRLESDSVAGQSVSDSLLPARDAFASSEARILKNIRRHTGAGVLDGFNETILFRHDKVLKHTAGKVP
jgi:hypothetical protein